MRASRLQQSLDNLSAAMREVESALGELRATRDPLAEYIYRARRHYREMSDTKAANATTRPRKSAGKPPATTATAAPSPNGPGCFATLRDDSLSPAGPIAS